MVGDGSLCFPGSAASPEQPRVPLHPVGLVSLSQPHAPLGTLGDSRVILGYLSLGSACEWEQ